MRKFIRVMSTFVLVVLLVHLLLILPIPADRNHYLQEYNHKIELLEQTSSPRIIFIGGSNTAFGICSPAIADSLERQVVNFGLHGGIGIRYPMEDALSYIREGDVVVLQIEYAHFFGETCNAETMPKLMAATCWRKAMGMTFSEWRAVLSGLPLLAFSNLKRLILWPFRGTLHSPTPSGYFKYTASGFNEYGDEVSHLNYPSIPYLYKGRKNHGHVDKEFCLWLQSCLNHYERRGATVVMLPPSCTESCLNASYSADIAEALRIIGYPYVTEAQEMTVPDSLSFDSGYHLNKEGVRLNTMKIIGILLALSC